MKLGKGVNESRGSDTPQTKRNNLLELLGAMPVKVYIKDGRISK